jgi:hypothetical protein
MIIKDKPLKTYTVRWTETRTVDVVATTPADAISTAMAMGGNVERKHGYIVLKEDYIAQESSMRGGIPKDEIVWRSVLDSNTCDICRALHNTPVKDLTEMDLLHFKGHNGCHATNQRGCRCHYLNVTQMKTAFIQAIGAEYSFKRVSDTLWRMEAKKMVSREEAINFLSRCVRDECHIVRLEIIDIINNFKFTAGEKQKP